MGIGVEEDGVGVEVGVDEDDDDEGGSVAALEAIDLDCAGWVEADGEEDLKAD